MSLGNLGQLNFPGQENKAGDKRALYIYKYTQEVLTGYDKTLLFKNLSKQKPLSPGNRGFSFPLIDDAMASYHTPGTQMEGGQFNNARKYIEIDSMLHSSLYLDEVDKFLIYTNERMEYSVRQGVAIATKEDANIAMEYIKGSKANNLIPGKPGGTVIKSDKFKLDTAVPECAQTDIEKAKAISGAIFKAAQIMDEKNIPAEGRKAVLRPSEYWVLFNHLDLINQWYGGQGSLAEGQLARLAGFDIIRSNNIPKTDTTQSGDAMYDPYHGVDATKTVALLFRIDGVATVDAKPIHVVTSDEVKFASEFLSTRLITGCGWLRPENIVQLSLDTQTN